MEESMQAVRRANKRSTHTHLEKGERETGQKEKCTMESLRVHLAESYVRKAAMFSQNGHTHTTSKSRHCSKIWDDIRRIGLTFWWEEKGTPIGGLKIEMSSVCRKMKTHSLFYSHATYQKYTCMLLCRETETTETKQNNVSEIPLTTTPVCHKMPENTTMFCSRSQPRSFSPAKFPCRHCFMEEHAAECRVPWVHAHAVGCSWILPEEVSRIRIFLFCHACSTHHVLLIVFLVVVVVAASILLPVTLPPPCPCLLSHDMVLR